MGPGTAEGREALRSRAPQGTLGRVPAEAGHREEGVGKGAPVRLPDEVVWVRLLRAKVAWIQVAQVTAEQRDRTEAMTLAVRAVVPTEAPAEEVRPAALAEKVARLARVVSPVVRPRTR
jgi:hypothetical protein